MPLDDLCSIVVVEVLVRMLVDDCACCKIHHHTTVFKLANYLAFLPLTGLSQAL